MSALGSLLREPNCWNLEEAGHLTTVRGKGAGSFEDLFQDWLKARNKLILKEPYLGQPVSMRQCQACPVRTSTRKFVDEVRKEGQKEYPGKTMYEMICCIQAYFRIECKRNITLVNKKGCNFCFKFSDERKG